MKGSLSVEAALVFPFCMAVIGAVCWIGLYKYNVAVLHLTGSEAAAYMTQFRELSEKDFEKEILKYTGEKAKKRLLSCSGLEIELKTTPRTLVLKFTGMQRMIFDHAIHTEMSYTKIHPEAALRLAAFGQGG